MVNDRLYECPYCGAEYPISNVPAMRQHTWDHHQDEMTPEQRDALEEAMTYG